MGLLVVLMAAAACASGGSTPPSDRPVTDSITIQVVNNNFYDANIYAQYDGQNRNRLGMVFGHGTGTFYVRWHQSDLRMVMSLVGGGTATSNSLVVSPGDVVRLELMPDLHLRTSRGRPR
jgi:hypothetical protein